jgi:hypothetical protein
MPSKVKCKIVVRVLGMQPWGVATLCVSALLLGAFAAATPAAAQAKATVNRSSTEVAITYDLERAKVEAVSCGCFWLQGGSVSGAVPIYKGWSIAGSFAGAHASNIKPGVDSNKLSYLAGPRYTLDTSRRSAHSLRVFGEALFGGAHGFGSIFPSGSGVTSSANSYAMQLGGGVDVPLGSGFGLRAVEADYVRTGLPNNGTNTQNDLRLAFGLSYRFNKK